MWTAALLFCATTLTLDADTRLTDLAVEREGTQTRITFDGQTMTPDQLVLAIESAQQQDQKKSAAFRFFNINSWTGITWIAVGLGGQLMFTLRLAIQWLVSEKNKKSIIPVTYWWFSLLGASMLGVYFFWRWDVVGILGQSFGWVVYLRNLYFIYQHKPSEVVAS